MIYISHTITSIYTPFTYIYKSRIVYYSTVD